MKKRATSRFACLEIIGLLIKLGIEFISPYLPPYWLQTDNVDMDRECSKLNIFLRGIKWCNIVSFFFRFVASVSGDTLQSDASANISHKRVGAPIAKQPQHTSGLFGENRSVDRSGCATDSNRGKAETTSRRSTIWCRVHCFFLSDFLYLNYSKMRHLLTVIFLDVK